MDQEDIIDNVVEKDGAWYRADGLFYVEPFAAKKGTYRIVPFFKITATPIDPFGLVFDDLGEAIEAMIKL